MEWFKNLNIATKLVTGFASVIVLIIVMTMLNYSDLNSLRKMQDEGATRSNNALEADHARRIPYKMYKVIANAELNRNIDDTQKLWTEVKKEWSDLIAELNKDADTDSEKEWLIKSSTEIDNAILTFDMPQISVPVKSDLICTSHHII